MAFRYLAINDASGNPTGKCKYVSGDFDDRGVWTTWSVINSSVDCPPALKPPTTSTSIRKMEILGTEVDTNTILKWVAIIAVVVLAIWYIRKKMR